MGDECWHGVCEHRRERRLARHAVQGSGGLERPRRSREATADDGQSRSTCLLNAAPHVLIVSVMIIIWSAERVRVGAIFDRRLSSER
jgi:hypothetical protein